MAGSDSTYYDVTLDEATLAAENPVAPSAADYRARMDWRGVGMNFVSFGTR